MEMSSYVNARCAANIGVRLVQVDGGIVFGQTSSTGLCSGTGRASHCPYMLLFSFHSSACSTLSFFSFLLFLFSFYVSLLLFPLSLVLLLLLSILFPLLILYLLVSFVRYYKRHPLLLSTDTEGQCQLQLPDSFVCMCPSTGTRQKTRPHTHTFYLR